MDDLTFASIDVLARQDNSWDVSSIELPCVPFDTSAAMVNGGVYVVNAAQCIGHGGGRLVASTYSPRDVSSSRIPGIPRITWYTPSYDVYSVYLVNSV